MQKVNQISKTKLSPYGVTPAQYALLRVLWKEDGQVSSVLGEKLQLDSATLTGMIDRLEQNEFIERRFDPSDRRNRLIFLTEKGQSMEEKLCNKMDEMNEEVMSSFAEEEFLTFKQILFEIGIKNKVKKRTDWEAM